MREILFSALVLPWVAAMTADDLLDAIHNLEKRGLGVAVFAAEQAMANPPAEGVHANLRQLHSLAAMFVTISLQSSNMCP